MAYKDLLALCAMSTVQHASLHNTGRPAVGDLRRQTVLVVGRLALCSLGSQPSAQHFVALAQMSLGRGSVALLHQWMDLPARQLLCLQQITKSENDMIHLKICTSVEACDHATVQV